MMDTNELNDFLQPNLSRNSKRFNHQQKKFVEYSADELEKDRIDAETDVPDLVPAIWVGSKTIANKGEFCLVGGKQKAGKSSLIIPFVATAFIKDSPEKKSKFPIHTSYAYDKPVIYIDTEMGKPKTKYFYKGIQRMLGTDKNIPGLLTYSFSEYISAQERLNRFKSLIKLYPDTHLWVIDHIADLGLSVNNEEKANELLQWLNGICKKLNTVFIIVMHENPGVSEKMRGHLGSEGLRKASGILGIKKDKEHKIYKVESRNLRHDEDFETIIMEWNHTLGRIAPVTEARSEEIMEVTDKETIKREKHLKLAKRCLLDGSERIKHSEFINRMRNHAPSTINQKMAEGTAKGWLKRMNDYGIIEKDEDGKYRLVS